jgi:hypothetical protein
MGSIAVSPATVRQLTQSELAEVIRRHSAGDWGDVSSEQQAANELALRNGGPVFSEYRLSGGRIVDLQTDEERRSSYVALKEPEEPALKRGSKLFADKLTKGLAGEFFYLIGRSIWTFAKHRIDRNKHQQ